MVGGPDEKSSGSPIFFGAPPPNIEKLFGAPLAKVKMFRGPPSTLSRQSHITLINEIQIYRLLTGISDMKITWFYSTASAFDATDQELSDSTDLPYGKPAPNFHVHFFYT